MHKQPAIAVDCVVFDNEGRLLLIKRKNAPFKSEYALPGGFVEYGEATETAARRELAEETSLKVGQLHLVADRGRGQRGRGDAGGSERSRLGHCRRGLLGERGGGNQGQQRATDQARAESGEGARPAGEVPGGRSRCHHACFTGVRST